MDNTKSVFYTTIGEFSNCGSLYDYLKTDFDFFSYLDLKSRFRKDLRKTTLYVYLNGELQLQKELYTIPANIPEVLAPLQHVVFFINVVRALWVTYTKNSHKTVDIALTTFSVTALALVICKKLGFCKKTLLWHWDYMPLPSNSRHQLLLKLVEPLDKLAIKLCDYVWYASHSQFEIRKNIGQIGDPQSGRHKVLHWGNNPKLTKPKQANSDMLNILFMGSLLPEKGLMELLSSVPAMVELTGGKIKLAIAGEANDTSYKETLLNYVIQNRLDSYVDFVGYAKGDFKRHLLVSADLGFACYPEMIDNVKNYAYYSDPAKLRDYISYGVPILLTNVPEISKDLVSHDAGLLAENLSSAEISRCVSEFIKDKQKYLTGAYEFSKTDYFMDYYRKQFDEIIG